METEELREELRELARILGEPRNIGVILTEATSRLERLEYLQKTVNEVNTVRAARADAEEKLASARAVIAKIYKKSHNYKRGEEEDEFLEWLWETCEEALKI